MIVETKRTAFTEMEVDLKTKVGAGVTYSGKELDFDFANQFKETGQTLEVFVTKKVTSAGASKLQVIVETKDPNGDYETLVTGKEHVLSASKVLEVNDVVAKIIIPDEAKQIIRVSLVNNGVVFTGGKVAGLIRPL